MKSAAQTNAPHVDPFADTMRISLIDDTVPLSRLSPKGEFHEGELAWFGVEDDGDPPGPATDALAEASRACPAASWFIVAGAAALPFVVLALF